MLDIITYTITYSVKRLKSRSGEFSKETETELCSTNSVTNEAKDIFTDLYFQHRGENVTGIEILSIQKKELSPAEIIMNGFSLKQQLLANI